MSDSAYSLYLRFGVKISPEGATILIAQITGQPDSPLWGNDQRTSDLVIAELVEEGLIAKSDLLKTNVFKTEHGYPIYRVGYEKHLESMISHIKKYQNLFSIGRQGRFAYINTHVAMKMGYDTAREIQKRPTRSV